MNQLFVDIDVSYKNNKTYLIKLPRSKHSSFSVQNNLGGANLMSEKIILALAAMQLSDVAVRLRGHFHLWEWPGVCTLRGDSCLGQINVLNPAQMSYFMDSYPDQPKNT